MHKIFYAVGTLNFKLASISCNNLKESISNSIKVNVYMSHNMNHYTSIFKTYVAFVWLKCLILRLVHIVSNCQLIGYRYWMSQCVSFT